MKTIIATHLLSALVLFADVKIQTASTLPAGTKGAQYFLVLKAGDGQTPYQWSLRSGSLPPGVFLNFGHLIGVPVNAGTYSFKLRVRDGDDGSASRTFSLTIAPAATPAAPTFAPALMPPGAFIVVPYSVTNAVPWTHVDGYGRTNYADGYVLTTNRIYEVQFSDNALGTNWQSGTGNGTWFHHFKTSFRPEPLGFGTTDTRMQGPVFYWSTFGSGPRKFRIVDWTDALVKPCPFTSIFHGCYE